MAPFSSPSHDSTNLNTLNSTMRIWIPLALAASSLAAPAMGYQHPGHDSVEATRQEIREIRAELRALRQEIKGQAQEARVHVLETARSGNVMHPQSNERVIIQRAQAGGTLWTPKAPTAPHPAMPGMAPQVKVEGYSLFTDAKGNVHSFGTPAAAPKSDCDCSCCCCGPDKGPSAMAPGAPQMKWTTSQAPLRRLAIVGGGSNGPVGMGPEDGMGKAPMRFEFSFDGDSIFMNEEEIECEVEMECEEEEIVWESVEVDHDAFFVGGTHGGKVYEHHGDEGAFEGQVENHFWSSDDGDIDVEIEALLQDLKGQQGDHKVIIKRINMPHLAEGANIDVQVQDLIHALNKDSKAKPAEVKLNKVVRTKAAAPTTDIDAEIEALLAELNGDKSDLPKVQKVKVEMIDSVPSAPAVALVQPAKAKAPKDSDQKRIKELEAEVAELRSMVDALIKELNQQ
jgi:hypothetical protein